MRREHWPRLAYNWVSTTGAVVSLVVGLTIVFLLVLNLFSKTTNPYAGVLLYLVLPFFLAVALLLIPLGMYLRSRALKKGRELHPYRWPSIDLNNPRYRNAAAVFVFGSLALVLTSSVGVYKAYQFTDSVGFCGLVCHKVMAPEYTTYSYSPHARVKCVDCHIGPGAGWYAKSKLSGLYQVYATLMHKYPRPIPNPIKDLRPLQAECYQCHWPSHFFGAQQRVFVHYRYDEKNTYWPVNLLIETGGGYPGAAQTSGIHWHMNIAVKIEYIARDRQNQDIPWIRATDKQTGRSVVYEDVARPLESEKIKAADVKVMDCIDCHNRPSHIFNSPDSAIDLEIFTGRIPADLPEAKKVCVEAMAKEYASSASAAEGIEKDIRGFYRTRYPEIYAGSAGKVDDAVSSTRAAFKRNVFPDMKARWSGYPNNIGHFYFRGCMRCHDGDHKSASGRAVSNGCNTCHIILSQGDIPHKEPLDLKKGQEFVHPVDIGDAWKGGVCFECHSGSQPM